MTRRKKHIDVENRADHSPAASTRVHLPAPRAGPRAGTKIALVLDLLRTPGGVTVAEIGAATGWQAHTVRGALAGTIKRRMGLDVVSDKEPGQARRYRLAE